jgi:hypothetical protein
MLDPSFFNVVPMKSDLAGTAIARGATITYSTIHVIRPSVPAEPAKKVFLAGL